MATPESIYVPDGDGFAATELARGPWDPNAQHGGAPAALLARAIERHEPDPMMQVTRLTIELLRPVPLGHIDVRARTLRPGKKVQLIEATLIAGGAEVARATGLRIRRKPLDLPEGSRTSERLDRRDGERYVFERVGPVSFGGAMDIVVADGGIDRVGHATVWFRLRVPFVAGEDVSPLMRVAAAADFGNGISSVVDWNAGWLFINPDLTVYLNRDPEGEWVALDALTFPSGDGVGFAESALYDEQGRIGRSVQSLLFDRLEPTAEG
jgi:hypothetical protein